MNNHRFDWKWYLKDLNPDKDINVFTTFSCGGGSSMGYKRAGFHVIGNVEIDPKINAMYVKNHHPKYNFNMDLRKFNEKEDLPEELYHLDILDGSPPCFAAGTKVKTKQGYKAIENILPGEMVLTHKGRYRKVIDTMSHMADNCYEVKIQGVMPIVATGNHPFFVCTMVRDKDGKRCFSGPEWVSVESLVIEKGNDGTTKKQSYVGIPVNNESKIPRWDGVYTKHCLFGHVIREDHKHNIDVTSEAFWEFIGAWFGDGWRRKDRKVVYLCCAYGEQDWLRSLIENAGFRAHFSEERTSIRAEISSAELYEFLEPYGDGACKKHLTDEIISLPESLLRSFMDGYLSTDGHYYEQTRQWACTSVSHDLILGLQQVIAKLYRQPTEITYREHNCDCIEERKVNAKPSYSLRFFMDARKQQHFIYENGYIWLPFRWKKPIEGQAMVYNLSVDEDESYTVSNIAVHNCTTFSSAGQREKTWGKLKKFREGQAAQTLDDLFFVFLDTVEKLKPKVVCAENVPGLLHGNAKGYVNLIIKRFRELGYEVQIFSLNAARMDVPSARHRIFFVANRMGYPKLKLDFHYDAIPFGDVRAVNGRSVDESTVLSQLAKRAKEGDRSLEDPYYRMTGKKGKYFTTYIVADGVVAPAITSGGETWRMCDRTPFTDEDYRNAQSFPQDYDFCCNEPKYVCGMSVPPNMMANIATEIYDQWLSK